MTTTHVSDRGFILRTIRNPKGKPVNGLTPLSWFRLADRPVIQAMIADGTLVTVKHPTKSITYVKEA